MSLIRESLKRLILQRLDAGTEIPPGLNVDVVLEADVEKLKQIAEEIKFYHQQKVRKNQVIETSEVISFEEAVQISGYTVELSKWAEVRFKEFFLKRNAEDGNIINLYAQMSSGNLFMWDVVTEKWKKVK